MDFYEGSLGSSPEIYSFEDFILLTPYSSEFGRQLFISDGTTSGTALLKYINPFDADAKKFTSVGDKVFFEAESEDGKEIWVTDGTEQGTYQVKDINPGQGGLNIFFLSAVDDKLFFIEENYIDNLQFGFSDGTDTGTLTYDFGFSGFNNYYIEFIGNFGNKVVFTAEDTNGVQAVWSSDGMFEGTKQIYYENKTAYSYAKGYNYIGNGKYVFRAFDPQHGYEPWITDGTAAGTYMLKDISQGVESSMPTSSLLYFTLPSDKFFVVHNNLAYFIADSEFDGLSLWRTDGTYSGTFQVSDDFIADIYYLGTVNNRIVFVEEDWTISLKSTDGSISGTLNLPIPAPSEPFLSTIEYAVVADSYLYYIDDNKLYKTDGTPAGSSLVKNFESGNLNLPLFSYDGNIYFSAKLAGDGYKLWKSDGTSGGTQVFYDPGNQVAKYFREANGLMFYFMGNALWKTDGTEAGTSKVKDMSNGFFYDLATVNGTLYFYEEYIGPQEKTYLWVSDGTEAGTSVIAEFDEIIYGCYFNYHYSYFIPAKDRMFFITNDSIAGREFWVSDGTAAGTHFIKDISPEQQDLWKYTAVLDTFLLFWANDFIHGEELWITDGTECFTQIVKDFNEGPAGSNYDQGVGMISNGDTLLFTVNQADSGVEPWIYVLPEINGTEIINGLDDNCNGMVDEFPVADFNQVEESSLILFPNPSSDYFEIHTRNIHSKIVSITIFNLLGVASTNCYITNLNDGVNVKHTLLPGNYLVQLTTEDSVIVTRLIVLTN